MKKIKSLLFSLALSVGAMAQQAVIQATLDTNTILIGEQTTLTITSGGIIPGSAVIWPMWPDTLKSIEVISQKRDTLPGNGANQIIEKFVITSFDSGYAVIPPFLLVADGDSLKTEPLILNIGTVTLNPDQDLYDIKGPVDPPLDILYWLKKLWYVSALVALALIVIFWLWLRKRKEKAAAAEIPDLRTPAQRATDRLLDIKKALLWQHGEVKEYYSQVTEATRIYLEEAYHVKAMEAISDELLDEMRTKISAEAHESLSRMLAIADAVKFAKMIPGPDQHTQILENALDFVERTKPVITPENE